MTQSSVPLISILCFVKNDARRIRRCVESVLALDYPNIEFVVQDSVSTDGTREILEQYARDYPEIVRMVSEEDSGADEGFFRAIKRCRGDYIGSCLSDEALLPGACAWATRAFNSYPEAGAVYGDLYLTDGDGENPRPWSPPPVFTLEKYILHKMNPPFAASFFRRSALEAIQYQTRDWSLKLGEYEFWVRIGAKFSVQYVPGFVTHYAEYERQRSARKDILLEMMEYRLRFQKELLGEPEFAKIFGAERDKVYAGTYLITSEVLRTYGYYKEAAELLLKANRLRPDADHNSRLMQGAYTTGAQLDGEGRLQDALQCWTPLVSLGVKIPEYADLKKRAAAEAANSAYWERLRKCGPLVSVVILCHNYARFLNGAFDSVIAQTYPNFEVIIVDDGSNDKTPEIIADLVAKHSGTRSIRAIRLSDVGPSAARSAGIKAAQGVYYVPLDADDRMNALFLERTVSILEENPKVGFAYTDQQYFGDRNERVSVPEFDLGLLAGANFIAYCSLVRKAAFEAVGGYDAENWGYYEDWDLWLRMGEAGWCGKRVPLALFRYNFHFGSSLSYFAKRLNGKYLAYVRSKHPRLYRADVIAAAQAELADMYGNWHSLPPMRSIDLIQSTLAANPGNSHLLYFLAEAQRKLGKNEAARETVADLLRQHPNDELGIQLSRTMSPSQISPDSSLSSSPAYSRRIIALMSAYNEGDVIYHVIGDLIANGLEVYLLDNNSSDNTVEEASRWLGKGLIKVERFPDEAGYSARCSREYVWKEILSRKEEIAASLDATWFLHVDADEFRESPWPGKTLADAIWQVDALGYNALNFELFNFRPTDDGFVDGTDVRLHLTRCEIGEWFNALQIKAWRNTGVRVQLAANGGHSVMFANRRVFPLNFILRHYPIRGERHGRRKVFQDRLPRFAKEEVAQQWHIQYNEFAKGEAKFLHDPQKLVLFDGHEVRARLLGRFAEEQLLVSTLTGGHAPRGFNPSEVCAWVTRKLSLTPPLSLEMAGKMEQMLGQLLPTQAKGYQELKIEISAQMASVLDAILEAKITLARQTGEAQFAMMATLLRRALQAKAGLNPETTPPSPSTPSPLPGKEIAAPPATARIKAATLVGHESAAAAFGPTQASGPVLPDELVSLKNAIAAIPEEGLDKNLFRAWRRRLLGVVNAGTRKDFDGLLASGPTVEALRLALRSGLNRLSLLESDAREFERHVGELNRPRKEGAELDPRAWWSVALCRPAHLAGTIRDLAHVGAAIQDDFLGWYFKSPNWISDRNEVEAFHRHFVAALRWVTGLIQLAPGNPWTNRVAVHFVNHANCIPLGMTQENIKEAMVKRAAVIDHVLRAGGARLDVSVPRPPLNGRRIKIGFLAQHFGHSTEAHVTLSMLGLNSEKFETLLFAVAETGDAVEGLARQRASSLEILPKELAAQANTLRAASLDVLVFCTNITAVTNAVSLLAAHRLAPLQLMSYASPTTTGFKHIDGYIGGTFANTPESAVQFSEKLHLLDGPPGCLDYTVEPTGPTPRVTRGDLGIPEGVPLFINGASCLKVRPEMFEVWRKILAANPQAHLLLLPFNPHWAKDFPRGAFLSNLRDLFADVEGAEERIHWIDSLWSRAEVKEVLQLGTAYLDPFPFAGSIAVVDALEVGLPTVAWAGVTPRSRFSAALLQEAGVPELITENEESYIALATKLASEPDYGLAIGAKIRGAIAKGVRFLNSTAFRNGFEILVEDLVHKRRR